MTPRQVIPNLFTLAAMLAGFFSILESASGDFLQAAQLIMVSMVLDGLDGTMARALKGESKIGSELDTFVDMTSFGLAPAVLAYEMVLKDFGIQGVLIASAVVLSGVYRLSRFRVIDPHRGQRGFLGMPITVNGGWIAMWVYVTQSGVLDEEWFNLHKGPLAVFVWTCVLAFTVLQVSHIRYSKPTKDPLFLVPCILMVSLLFLGVHVGAVGALAMCSYAFLYAFVSPFIHRRHTLVVVEEEEDEEEPVEVHHWDE